jgi:hypothetical protein
MTMQQNAPDFCSPSHLSCPDCGALMRLSAVVLLQSARSTDEIAYRCDACGMEQKQIARPLQS